MPLSLDDGYRAMAADADRTTEFEETCDDKRFRAQITEVVNRNLLVTALLKLGHNAYLPVYDRGVDLIAYDEDAKSMKPIQLKGRWIIMEKYRGRGIWIAFPERDQWFLAPHDEMMKMGETMGYCDSPSWIDGKAYSCPSMSKKLRELMVPWALTQSSKQSAVHF